MNWMILPFKRFADFKGRSRRMEFWMFSLLNVIVWIVLGGMKMASGDTMAQLTAASATSPLSVYGVMFSGTTGILLALWSLAAFIPGIAVTVRRLHDRDMSGWWYLGFVIGSFIPLLNILISIGFLVLMFLEGTKGPNRFGPDPKDPTSSDVFA
ncbi:DUF805 domain-containing protein [Novosphingobium sp.]|uniref:DUF805 domain-containing protein n=1 Tax=Novosphingobium sp. TaxID=1874826 RepID=UPI0025D1BB4A|nr:DUF805 domain-containing protein [Novosphingobium sp.]